MTIGDGIFWSTIILIAFLSIILITKKKRWGTFFKVLAVFVLLGALIGVSVWFYTEYENRLQVASSLNRISLNMTEVEVTLAKGEPDHISKLEPTSDGFRKYLLYGDINNSYTYTMLRGPKDSMIVADICDKGGNGRVLGFSDYSSEKNVLKKIGKPTSVSIDAKGTHKILSYPKWNAAFEIAKGFIIKVCVTNRPQISYRVEYGYSAKDSDENENYSKPSSAR